MNKIVMTPGPTQSNEEIRNALSIKNTNTDLDKQFLSLYQDTCNKAKEIANAQNSEAMILLGEAILGLEAACASFIEKGDRVLVIDNGIFGRGFSDFIKLYEGEVVRFKSDYDKGINIENLNEFIKKNGPFKIATLVHCETPTGITNPIHEICPLLSKYNILSIVDAVSSYGGEKIYMDKWKIDVLLAGTQKCLSVTSGGTILFLSQKAVTRLSDRKSTVKSFYLNLKNWLNVYNSGVFPYTHSDALVNSINIALNILIEENSVNKHKIIAQKVRKTVSNCGLALYGKDHFANTLTAVMVPNKINFNEMFSYLSNKHNLLIGGSLAEFEGNIFRIGHMGGSCKEELIFLLFKALDDFFESSNLKLNKKLHIEFAKII